LPNIIILIKSQTLFLESAFTLVHFAKYHNTTNILKTTERFNHIAPKLAAATNSSSLLHGTKPKPTGAA
jgi:hypothetical protein